MKFQFSLFNRTALSHGGTTRRGRRKITRPIATKKPLHVVLKSSRAKNEWSFFRRKDQLEGIIYKTAKRFRVRIHLYENVGNHLHLAIQGASRREIQNFFRVLPQAIAYFVTGTRKGCAIGRFFDAPLFTRVVHWQRDWANLKNYFTRNAFEAAGAPRRAVDAWFQRTRGQDRLVYGPG